MGLITFLHNVISLRRINRLVCVAEKWFFYYVAESLNSRNYIEEYTYHDSKLQLQE
jgi:hypothetical protein